MIRRLALFWVMTFLLPCFSLGQRQPQDIHVWLTTVDRKELLTQQSEPLRFSETVTAEHVIEVNDTDRYQSMEGFGLALTGGSAELLLQMTAERRTALLKELFAPNGDGIRVSYLRVSIGSSDMNDHAYSYDDLLPGATDPHLEKFSLGIDRSTVIPVLKEILTLNPHVMILGSPWSAPAWMKTNDNLKGGHLKPEYYTAYAEYFVRYIEAMKAEGIDITSVTVQNEPLNPKNTPSMVMFAPEEGKFISEDLGPAFEKAGIRTTIQLYDHNLDVPSYPLSILKDPVANRYTEGTAFHIYGGQTEAMTKVHDAYPNKSLFLTEQSVTEAPHSETIDIAAAVDRVLIGATRNWARNVLLWNLAADPHAGPHTDNGGCTGCWGAMTLEGDDVTRNLAYYALAHFSKFVPAGSLRVGSTELEQLGTVAFLTPSGEIVAVVSNTGNFPTTFAIRYHGRKATATLPPESVGTYVWPTN